MLEKNKVGTLPAFPPGTPLPSTREIFDELLLMEYDTSEVDEKMNAAVRRASVQLRRWSIEGLLHNDKRQIATLAEAIPDPENRKIVLDWIERAARRPAPISRIGDDKFYIPSSSSGYANVHLASEHDCDCRAGLGVRHVICWHIVVVRAIANAMVARVLREAHAEDKASSN